MYPWRNVICKVMDFMLENESNTKHWLSVENSICLEVEQLQKYIRHLQFILICTLREVKKKIHYAFHIEWNLVDYYWWWSLLEESDGHFWRSEGKRVSVEQEHLILLLNIVCHVISFTFRTFLMLYSVWIKNNLKRQFKM